MKPLLVLGSSGHAGVLIDAVLSQKIFSPIGILTQDPDQKRDVLGVPVLGNDHMLGSILQQYPNLQIAIGVGDNDTRARLAEQVTQAHNNSNFATIIHPSAILAKTVKVGAGSLVCAGAIINNNAQIGTHVVVNTGAIVEHDTIVHDHAFIGPNVSIAGKVEIGAGSMVGIGATIIQNVKIGDGSTIGAGSVVLKNVDAKSVAVGNPAKVIRKL